MSNYYNWSIDLGVAVDSLRLSME